MGGEASDLVAKTLGWDHSDLIADALVGVEVEGETLVVALDHLLRCALDGLVTNAALRSVGSEALARDTGKGCTGGVHGFEVPDDDCNGPSRTHAAS